MHQLLEFKLYMHIVENSDIMHTYHVLGNCTFVEEDEEVEANTRANSLTNVTQYNKVPVKAEEVPSASGKVPKITSAVKGQSSLMAMAAAGTSIMFSMPVPSKVNNPS